MTRVAGAPAVLPKQVALSQTVIHYPRCVGMDRYPLMGPKGESFQQFWPILTVFHQTRPTAATTQDPWTDTVITGGGQWATPF